MAWADRSPVEQAALLYCAPRGIPLSVFLGRVVYPGEPMWLENDISAAMDWLAYERGRCDGCGQQVDETVGPQHFDKWNAEKTGACDGCRALARSSRMVDGNEELIPETTGARFRMWRDEEAGNGRVN